jgi:4-diphosphocytidyl-2-C-methyl-D-erythritol kinase
MWGIGDELRPVRDFPRLDAVLVTPAISVPSDKTRQVFGRLAARPVADLTAPEPLPRFGSADEAIEYVAAHRNDLTETARALMPGAGDAEHALASSDGCCLARMSGAGPSCFGLFETRQAAHAAARALSLAHPEWWVCAVVLG